MRLLSKGVLCAAIASLGAALALVPSSPAADEPAKSESRVFEIRTYTAPPGKLDALHARFRDHTLKLFEKHGMKNIIYLVPTDEKLSKNTLIYIIQHDSKAAADKSWAAFRADPDWTKARDASEKDGKLVEKVDVVFCTAADYSPIKK